MIDSHRSLLVLLGSIMLLPLTVRTQQLNLSPLFSDGMVLQQQRQVPVWGTGKPRSVVHINTSWGTKASCSVGTDSTWKTQLQTPKAGGPFTVHVLQDSISIILKDVLIGEVWLCSGQSNMEMPLSGWPPADTISNSAAEIAQAQFPKIRMFTVERKISLTPTTDCKGSWKQCSPEEAGTFSATAYFFGKKLFTELHVPIGLIHSSWGGTPVQAWTSEPFILMSTQYAGSAEKFAKTRLEYEQLTQWLSARPTIDLTPFQISSDWRSIDLGDSSFLQTGNFDSSWSVMELPQDWERTSVGSFDGVVWFRKKVEIPSAWRGKELTLELGPIDDLDITFVNGKKIGGMETGSPWNINRVYTVPAAFVTDSALTIAVRVIDTGGGGGMWGSASQMRLHPADSAGNIPLSGSWKYLPIAEIRNRKAYVFDFDKGTVSRPHLTTEFGAEQPAALYNGMIAPLIPYSIKGTIWYQGESNTEDAAGYAELFPLMIRNWRSDWRSDFPFYFVQIAPFRYEIGTPSHRLREAQLHTLSVPRTGMAVTLDIGDSATIHPSDKKDVGERLARWALAKDYGKKNEYSGPVFRSFTTNNSTAVLTFDHAEGLTVKSSAGKNFFVIAGEDSLFHPADVSVKGKKLVVRSNDVKRPKAVRYAWGNIVEATLFNKAGLPASSFRTDQWK